MTIERHRPFWYGPEHELGFDVHPPLGEPVMWYDTRDWCCGPGLPDIGEADGTLERITGIIPNQGTAGGYYNINWVGRRFETGPGQWIIDGGALEWFSTGSPLSETPLRPPASMWDDLGGLPADAPWCFMIAFGCTDSIAGFDGPFGTVTRDLRQWRFTIQRFPEVSPGVFHNYDLDIGVDWFSGAPTNPVNIDVEAVVNNSQMDGAIFDDRSATWSAEYTETGGLLLVIYFDVRACHSEVSIDGALIPPSAMEKQNPWAAVAEDADMFNQGFVNPESWADDECFIRIGWISGGSYYEIRGDDKPEFGDALYGITGWAVYRGSPTHQDIAEVREAFGLNDPCP